MSDSDHERMRSRSRSPLRGSRSRSRSPRRNKNDRQRPFMGGRRIVVRNIPYEVKWQDLKDTFRKEIGEVTYVEMLETPEGKSKGVAVVEFRDSDHAKKAIEEFHQKKIKDRAIIVREEREKDRQEFAQSQRMRERGRMGAGVGSMMGGGLGLAGINPQILAQLNIDGPISNTVFVANLDYNVTWWKLKDVFKLAGNVIKAEIKEDKNGKSRGMGIVIYETPLEALQAVSLFNGQRLYERNIIVRIDKEKGGDRDRPKLPSGLKSIGMGLGLGGAPLSNLGQLGSNLGLGGGSGLLGNLGGGGMGGSGLGLLGAGMGGGGDLGLGMGGLGGGLGGGLSGMGLGGSGSHSSGGLGSMGLGGGGLGGSDLGLGGLGGSSKMGGGMSDSYSNSYSGMGGSSYNGSGSLSGLGLGQGLGSLSGGMGGSGDRLGMGDAFSLARDRLALDRMGGLGSDRMSGLDRMTDKLRDNYGSSRGRDRDDGNRRQTRPDNATIVVKNLPYSVSWQTLKEHFRDTGDVKFAEIVMDNGKSTGVGYVRFGSELDAQRAISLKNRSRVENRNITVAIHRSQ